MEDRLVKAFFFDTGSKREPEDGETFQVVSEFHRDRTEEWIVVIKDGKEISRFNTRYIVGIVWLEGIEPKQDDLISFISE